MATHVLTEKEKQVLPWLASVGFFMQSLDGTILNTALPSIATDLQQSPLQMQAAVISYMLTVAMLIPASGWLADRYGTRSVFFTSILLFTIGSLLCAQSSSLNELIVWRIMQGVGGALLVPVGRLTILKAFPREEFLRVFSMVVIPGLIGPLIGPLLGGWLVDHASWPWIFLINLPIGVLGCVLTAFYMPNLQERTPQFDWRGYVFFGLGIVLVSIAIQILGERDYPDIDAVYFGLPGVIALYLYWQHSHTHTNILFHQRLFTINTFRIGILGNLVARIGSGALPFLIPLYLQIGLGFDPTSSGLTMIPMALGAIAVKVIATRTVLHFGYRNVLIGNTVILGAMITGMATISASTPTLYILVYLGILGMFNSMQFTAMNTVTLNGLDNTLASSGNSLLSVVMQLSMSLGVSFSAILLTWYYSGHAEIQSLDGSADPDILRAFHLTFMTVGILSMFAMFVFRKLQVVDRRSQPSQQGS